MSGRCHPSRGNNALRRHGLKAQFQAEADADIGRVRGAGQQLAPASATLGPPAPPPGHGPDAPGICREQGGAHGRSVAGRPGRGFLRKRGLGPAIRPIGARFDSSRPLDSTKHPLYGDSTPCLTPSNNRSVLSHVGVPRRRTANRAARSAPSGPTVAVRSPKRSRHGERDAPAPRAQRSPPGDLLNPPTSGRRVFFARLAGRQRKAIGQHSRKWATRARTARVGATWAGRRARI